MTADLRAAEDAAVNAAIQKGRAYLGSKLDGAAGGQKSLAAYALVKTGTDKADPRIQGAVAATLKAVQDHYSPGKPRFGHEFAYTVATHMFLLEAVDPELYEPELTALAGYMIEHQQGNGSWYYSISQSQAPLEEGSDSSQTQFALLGLWAAQRAGVEIPSEVWQKAGAWFLRTQREDGSFAYQPDNTLQPQLQEVRPSVTIAGTGSLLLIRHIFYPDSHWGENVVEVATPKKSKKHGVLDQFRDEQTKEPPRTAALPAAALDKGVDRGIKAIVSRFSARSNYQLYLFYAMERMAALMDSETIGPYEWYPYASRDLLLSQTADGAWSDNTGDLPATSFAILCLSRATATLLGRAPAKKVGGGLLVGARGLPNDLSKLQLKDGQALERKSKGEVDDLLAELEKVQDVSVGDVQKAIVESVNLDDPEQLVGEIDRLRRLADDPRAEVRRTALWAIGRTGEIRLAPLLFKALSDVDVDVIQEASYGLTVLSRKPTGIRDDQGQRIPVEPLDGVDEDATDEQRQKHLENWLARAIPAWQKWYLQVRPYDEQDDRQTLKKAR